MKCAYCVYRKLEADNVICATCVESCNFKIDESRPTHKRIINNDVRTRI